MRDIDQIARDASVACSVHAYDVYRISSRSTSEEFYRIILAALKEAVGVQTEFKEIKDVVGVVFGGIASAQQIKERSADWNKPL